MAKVAKLTISLPPAQFAFLERLQALTGTSRSELIASALRAAELREREARYAAAYSGHPETREDLAFTDAATEDFFGGSRSASGSLPAKGSLPQRRPSKKFLEQATASRTAAAPRVRTAKARSRSTSTTASGKKAARGAPR